MTVSRLRQHFQLFSHWPFLTLRATEQSHQSYHRHQHECVSLGLITKGETDCLLGPQSHRLEQGDMVLIPAHLPHACNPPPGAQRSYLMLFVEEAWLVTQLGGDPACDTYRCDESVFKEGEQTDEMARWLRRLCQGEEHDLAVLLQFFIQHGHLGLRPAHTELLTSTEQIAKLAAREGLSREGFIRRIRREYGLPPHTLRNNQRIELAKRLIQQGDKLADVALAVGFGDQSQLHRHFVHFSAATPGQYRKSLFAKK